MTDGERLGSTLTIVVVAAVVATFLVPLIFG